MQFKKKKKRKSRNIKNYESHGNKQLKSVFKVLRKENLLGFEVQKETQEKMKIIHIKEHNKTEQPHNFLASTNSRLKVNI